MGETHVGVSMPSEFKIYAIRHGGGWPPSPVPPNPLGGAVCPLPKGKEWKGKGKSRLGSIQIGIALGGRSPVKVDTPTKAEQRSKGWILAPSVTFKLTIDRNIPELRKSYPARSWLPGW